METIRVTAVTIANQDVMIIRSLTAQTFGTNNVYANCAANLCHAL